MYAFWLKVHQGARIPWDCVIVGHQFKPHPAGGPTGYQMWYCSRPGCTYEKAVPLA